MEVFADMCTHSREELGDLQSFLDWYVATKQNPTIYTSLTIHGLPAGRGRKGGIPKWQWSKVQPRAEISVLCPATCSSESHKVSACTNAAAAAHLLPHTTIFSLNHILLVFVPRIYQSHLSQCHIRVQYPMVVRQHHVSLVLVPHLPW